MNLLPLVFIFDILGQLFYPLKHLFLLPLFQLVLLLELYDILLEVFEQLHGFANQHVIVICISQRQHLVFKLFLYRSLDKIISSAWEWPLSRLMPLLLNRFDLLQIHHLVNLFLALLTFVVLLYLAFDPLENISDLSGQICLVFFGDACFG